VDGSGNVVVTGAFYGTADFGAGAVTSPFAWAIFVTKYSASGTALWSRSAGGSMTDSGTAVAMDAAGNVVATGNFGNGLNFGTGSFPGSGMFLAKFTPSGTPVWVKGMGARARGVAVDASSNVVMTGGCGFGSDLGGGPMVATALTVCVAKYSPAGTYLWSQAFGNVLGNEGEAVAVDASSNVVVTGYMDGADFGAGQLTSAGSDDIFLYKRAP